jgi:hypothetical protein
MMHGCPVDCYSNQLALHLPLRFQQPSYPASGACLHYLTLRETLASHQQKVISCGISLHQHEHPPEVSLAVSLKTCCPVSHLLLSPEASSATQQFQLVQEVDK